YALHGLDAAAAHAGRALGLADDSDPVGRLQLELLSTEISFYRDGNAFLSGGGPEQLHALADRLLAHGDDACAARAWTLLGQAAWLRADRTAAVACLNRAVALFEPLPDSGQKADAHAELGRLHMLNYERDEAVAAAETAAGIGARLGLAEVNVNARITAATARYQAGDRSGIDELHALVESSRAQQLLALPRALQNLAFALREEGDWVRSDALLTTAPEARGSGQTLATSYSGEAMRAYFDGDFGRLVAAADAFVDTPTGGWDMQVRGLRSCLLVLRGQPVPPAPRPAPTPRDGGAEPVRHRDDVAAALDDARRSGFHRPHWTMLGMAALCRALQGRADEAAELIDELAVAWSAVPALASGEWIAAAAYAASLVGRDAAVRVRAMLDRLDHRTPWSEAALRTVTGALAAADGDHRRAGELHLAGAEIYARIPDVTDRMLALALAVAELDRAGDDDAAAAPLAEVRAFAQRNEAPGLLALARHPVPDTGPAVAC
ncbi:adenylyl cyclase, partial [Micromonospora sp. NPDC003776]